MSQRASRIRGVRALLPPVLALALVAGCSGEQKRSTPALTEGLGYYASTVQTADGQMDVDQTVQVLRDAGATRYYYLVNDPHWRPGMSVNPSPGAGVRATNHAWHTLPQFALAAEQAGIEVVVYLVPPTESTQGGYKPYGWDYVAWAAAVAKLAREHPNVTGMVIDDFAANSEGRGHDGRPEFTPAVTGRIRAALRSGGGDLRLYALMYGQDFVGRTAILARYRTVLDGVVYAFAGPDQLNHAPQNTVQAQGVDATTRRARDVSGCRTSRSCWQFLLRQPPGTAPALREAQVTTVAELTGDAHTFSFWVTDDRRAAAADPYSVQVRVAGRVVPTRLTGRREGYWREYQAGLTGTSSSTHELELAVSVPATTRGVSVLVSDPHVDGRPVPVSGSGVSTSGSQGTATEVVEPLPLVLMIYAAPLGRDIGAAGAAAPGYVATVLRQGESLVRAGKVDGLVAYRANLSGEVGSPAAGDPANLALFRTTYQRLQQG